MRTRPQMDEWQNRVCKGLEEDRTERQTKILPFTRRTSFSFTEMQRKEENYTEGDKLVDIKRGNLWSWHDGIHLLGEVCKVTHGV